MREAVYRGAKLSMALILLSAGVARCPCGGWAAWMLGVVAGTALYMVLARGAPPLRPSLLARPAVWSMTFGAAADEVIWRGWFSNPGIRPDVLLYAVLASVSGFALAHLPRQGSRGVAVHAMTGIAFTGAVFAWGLSAAISAHVAYNLWVFMARSSYTTGVSPGEVDHGAARR